MHTACSEDFKLSGAMVHAEELLWERAGPEGTSRGAAGEVLGVRFRTTKGTMTKGLCFIPTILGRVFSRGEARQDTV